MTLLIAVLSAAPAIPGLVRGMRSRDVFDPLVLFALIYLIRGPVSATFLLIAEKNGAWVFPQGTSADDVVAALLWLAISSAILTGFFYISTATRHEGCVRTGLVGQLSRTTIRHLVVIFWATVLIRLVALPYGYGTWFVGDVRVRLSNAVASICSLHRVAYPLVLMGLTLGEGKHGVAALLGPVTAEFVITVLEGSKGAAMSSLLPAAFFWGLGRLSRPGKLGRTRLIGVVLAVVATILLFPCVDAYRTTGRFAIAAGQPSKWLPAMTQRLSWVPSFARVISAVPDEIGYWYGRSIWPAFVWFVPETLWSGKPPLSIGAWFAQALLGWTPGTLSEGAITIWGDAYLNFGVPGTIAVGVILGVLYGLIYRRWYRSAHSATDFLIYWLFISHFLLSIEKNLAAIVGAFGQQFLMSMALLLIARVRFPFTAWRRGANSEVEIGGV